MKLYLLVAFVAVFLIYMSSVYGKLIVNIEVNESKLLINTYYKSYGKIKTSKFLMLVTLQPIKKYEIVYYLPEDLELNENLIEIYPPILPPIYPGKETKYYVFEFERKGNYEIPLVPNDYIVEIKILGIVCEEEKLYYIQRIPIKLPVRAEFEINGKKYEYHELPIHFEYKNETKNEKYYFSTSIQAYRLKYIPYTAMVCKPVILTKRYLIKYENGEWKVYKSFEPIGFKPIILPEPIFSFFPFL